jgi:hypothetical protein
MFSPTQELSKMFKCSTCRFLCVSDGCFCAEKEDGVTAKGCLACNSGALTFCTKDKDFADTNESTAYDVSCAIL